MKNRSLTPFHFTIEDFTNFYAERIGGRRKTSEFPKIYYATQVAIRPVTILLFVNKAELFDENYRRFLIGKLRELLNLSEVPIRLLVRPRRRKEIKK